VTLHLTPAEHVAVVLAVLLVCLLAHRAHSGRHRGHG
jgi:hypothetical protein